MVKGKSHYLVSFFVMCLVGIVLLPVIWEYTVSTKRPEGETYTWYCNSTKAVDCDLFNTSAVSTCTGDFGNSSVVCGRYKETNSTTDTFIRLFPVFVALGLVVIVVKKVVF